MSIRSFIASNTLTSSPQVPRNVVDAVVESLIVEAITVVDLVAGDLVVVVDDEEDSVDTS